MFLITAIVIFFVYVFFFRHIIKLMDWSGFFFWMDG
jgi:hypothetical protein